MSGPTRERDPITAAFAELAETRPSPDLGPRIKAAVRRSPRAVPWRGRWIAGLAAALVIALGGAWLGLRSTPGPATSSPSPGPSGSASQSAPGTSDLGPDTIARVTKDFSVGSSGQVSEGELVFVIAGPVDHDGRPAYLIQHYGNLGTGYQPAGNVAWLSPAMVADVLVRAEPVCPADASLASVAALQPFERILCFGSRDLTFDPVTASQYRSAPKVSDRWISTNGKVDDSTGLPVYGLTPPLEMVDHGWYRVTGHFEDASSADCGDAGEVAWCRERFMVTAATVVDPPSFVLDGAWRQTALPPIDGRSEFAMAWTGAEAVVWGGVSSSEARSVFDAVTRRDGAAYDPATDRWRVIPNAPIAGRSWPIMVWSGSEIIVFGGTIGEKTQLDGAAWNPRTNTWRPIADSPLTGSDVQGVWRAGRLNVVTATGAAMYDPAADRWTRLPAPPVQAGSRTAVVAADRVVIMAVGDTLTTLEWAVLDPATATWRHGTASVDPLGLSTGFIGAGEVVIEPTMGRVFDPVAGMWSSIPVCEGAGYGPVWTGSVVLGTRGAWDTRTQQCMQVPPSPPREPPFDGSNGREFPVAVWTGSQYMTWSGGNGGDIVWVPKDGAVFTPTNDLGPCCG